MRQSRFRKWLDWRLWLRRQTKGTLKVTDRLRFRPERPTGYMAKDDFFKEISWEVPSRRRFMAAAAALIAGTVAAGPVLAGAIGTIANGESGSSVRTKLNSTIGIVNLIYCNNSSNQSQSVIYQTSVAIGDAFQVDFFGSNNQIGSQGVWRCFATTGIGTLGTVSYLAGTGIVIEGVAGRFVFIPEQGSIVDIRACGIICDGSTTGQQSKLASLISAAVARQYVLTGGGSFKTTETLDMRRCMCDFSNMIIQAGIQNTGGANPFYPGGVVSGITTEDIILANGTTVTKGIVVRAAGNGSNSDRMEQKFWIKCDGDFDFTALSTCIAIRFETDDSPLAYYWADVGYAYVACNIQDSNEKNYIRVNGVYSTFLGYLSGATADTENVELHGNLCQHWWYEIEGTDTSVITNFYVEDNVDPLDGSPSIYFRSGKNQRIGGRIRGTNNTLAPLILVDKTTDVGVDSIFFDNLTIIHGSGTAVELRRVRHAGGQVMIKDFGSTGAGLSTQPCVIYKRIGDAGNLFMKMSAVQNALGLQVGQGAISTFTADTTSGSPTLTNPSSLTGLEVGQAITGTGIPANTAIKFINIGANTITLMNNATATNATQTMTPSGLYSIDCDYGEVAISMGILSPFNANGSENAGGFPTTLFAAEIVKMKGGSIKFSQIQGKLTLDAGVVSTSSGNPQIEIPLDFARYTLTNNATNADVGHTALTP